MKKLIGHLHDLYSKQYKGNDGLLRLMKEDLIDSNGHPQKARGLALNAIYHMDGGTKRRPMHQRSFDERLSSEEKAIMGDEAHRMAELAMMMYHPGFIISNEESPSENRGIARNALHRILRTHKHRPIEATEEKLLEPMYKMLLHEVFDENKALNSLLPEVMTHGTHHDPERYKKVLMTHFLGPAVHGVASGFWDQGIPAYMQHMEEKNAQT